MVKFYRGPSGSFNKEAHYDGLYFATDKGEIYLNDSVYGSGSTVTDVEFKDGSTLAVSYQTEEPKEFNLLELLATATNQKAGLMSAEDKTAFDAFMEAYEKGDFVKDGMLSSIDIVRDPEGKTGTFIVMTFNTDSGITEPMYVDVTDVFAVFVPGNGVSIKNNVISVKVAENDPYITVGSTGIASKGIDDAIAAAVTAVVGVEGDSADTPTIYGIKTYVADALKNVSATVTIDTTADKGVALEQAESGIRVVVNEEELAAALIGEGGPISGTTIKLGEDVVVGDAVLGQAGISVHSVIQTLANKIESSSNGGITVLEGDEFVRVSGSATTKYLSMNVGALGEYMVDNTSALKTNDGRLSVEWEEIE